MASLRNVTVGGMASRRKAGRPAFVKSKLNQVPNPPRDHQSLLAQKCRLDSGRSAATPPLLAGRESCLIPRHTHAHTNHARCRFNPSAFRQRQLRGNLPRGVGGARGGESRPRAEYGDDPWTARAVGWCGRFSRRIARCSSSSTGPRRTRFRWRRVASVRTRFSATNTRTWRPTSAVRRSFSRMAPRCCCCPASMGKITPDAIEPTVTEAHATFITKAARGQPHAIDGSSERFIRPQRLGAGRRPKALGLKLHMDGARFANAVASLGCAAEGADVAGGRRCALLWRDEERDAVRRGGRVLQSRALRGSLTTAASRAGSSRRRCASSRVVGRDAPRRRVAAACGARECDGRRDWSRRSRICPA